MFKQKPPQNRHNSRGYLRCRGRRSPDCGGSCQRPPQSSSLAASRQMSQNLGDQAFDPRSRMVSKLSRTAGRVLRKAYRTVPSSGFGLSRSILRRWNRHYDSACVADSCGSTGGMADPSGSSRRIIWVGGQEAACGEFERWFQGDFRAVFHHG